MIILRNSNNYPKKSIDDKRILYVLFSQDFLYYDYGGQMKGPYK